MFRYIELAHPTLLLDELDGAFEGNDLFRRFLNEGFRRNGRFIRCADSKRNYEPEQFDVFCPKALAGIGSYLPDTVVDRSIPISLRRKLPHQKKEKFRLGTAPTVFAPVLEQLGEWATAELVDDLRAVNPLLPDDLSGRAQDIWEPLFAIADHFSESWGQRARVAALALHQGFEDESIGVRCLRDLRQVWPQVSNGTRLDRVRSEDLAKRLSDLEAGPWGSWSSEWRVGFGPRALAKLLGPYGIAPSAMRINGLTAQGYALMAFEDPWERYLEPEKPNMPNSPNETDSSSTTAEGDVVDVADVDISTKTEELPF
jgi:putative DNA primase/helicase